MVVDMKTTLIYRKTTKKQKWKEMNKWKKKTNKEPAQPTIRENG